MNKTHLRTYANHIRTALVNRRDALKLELAVMFAVTLECEDNKRLAREAIYSVYHSTGSYFCDTPSARDWKSVGRHITAGFALFDFLGADEIGQYVEGKKHGELIGALVERIEPLKLGTINEVLTVCEKVRKPQAKKAAGGTPAGSHEFKTEHLHFVVPPAATYSELMDAIQDLMKLAEGMIPGKHKKAA